MESPFIDIHTHQRVSPPPPEGSTEIIRIYNLEPEEIGPIIAPFAAKSGQEAENTETAARFSAGIHPYRYLKDNELEAALQQLDLLCQKNRIEFIGECGLDRLKGPNLDRQLKTFRSQIDLAEKHQKPLIIHGVRVYDELIRIKKQQGIKVPAIIHGFRKSPETALQLYDHGFILSFGQAIMRRESKTAKALETLWERDLPFFLESDGSGLDIREIYGMASNLLKISTDTLKDAIFASWKKLF